MRRRVRVVRSGQDNLDGLEQVPDDIEIRAHVRLSEVDGVAQVQVFPAGSVHFDRQVDIGAVPESFETEVFIDRLPAFRPLLGPLAVLQHVQGDGMAASALLDFVQVLFRGPVVFHELVRVLLSEVLDEEGYLRVGILHDDVHGLDMPPFLFDAGQVEPEVVLGIQFLDGDFEPVAWRGQEDALLDPGHRHSVTFRLQPLELGGGPAGEPERFQLRLFQARPGVGLQVQVAIVDDGIDVHGNAGRERPAEALLAGKGDDGLPVTPAAARGVGKEGAFLRIEGEKGGLLEVLNLDVHDGPGAVFHFVLPTQADRDVDVAMVRFQSFRLGFAAGGKGESRSDEQCN